MKAMKVKAGLLLGLALLFASAVHKAEAVNWASAGNWCSDSAVDGSTTISGHACAGAPNQPYCGGTFSVRVVCDGSNCATQNAPGRQIEGWACPAQKIDSRCSHIVSNGQTALSQATPNYDVANWAACQLTQH